MSKSIKINKEYKVKISKLIDLPDVLVNIIVDYLPLSFIEADEMIKSAYDKYINLPYAERYNITDFTELDDNTYNLEIETSPSCRFISNYNIEENIFKLTCHIPITIFDLATRINIQIPNMLCI